LETFVDISDEPSESRLLFQ